MWRLTYGDLLDRTEILAISVIKYLRENSFQKTDMRLYWQLSSSITSVASNVAEANGAWSNKEFRRILRIALREANEVRSQMRIYTQAFTLDLSMFENETNQIIKILSSIIVSIEI